MTSPPRKSCWSSSTASPSPPNPSCRAPSAERRAPSSSRRLADAIATAFAEGDGECVVLIADAASPSGSPSAERRAPSAEHRAPSAERRAPSAEHRAPSAEHRAPSAEHRAPSPALRFTTHFACPDGHPQRAGAEPAALLLQQPARRLPHLQRLRRHPRLRPRPDRPPPRALPPRGRTRSVDEAALRQPPPLPRRVREEAGDPLRRALARPERRAARPVLPRAHARLQGDHPLPRGPRARNATSSTSGSSSANTRPRASAASCGGAKLRPEALTCASADAHIAAVSALPVEELAPWLDALPLSDLRARGRRAHPHRSARPHALPRRRGARLSLPRPRHAHPLRRRSPAHRPRELARRASGGRVVRAGRAEHRTAPARREPAAGTARSDCATRGTPCIVVEHDLEAIRAADYMVELGPGSGENGGRVVFSGRSRRAAESPLTGKYLTGASAHPAAGIAPAGRARVAHAERRARAQPEERDRRRSRSTR